MRTSLPRPSQSRNALTILVGALLLSSCTAERDGAPSSFDPEIADASPTRIDAEFFGMHDGQVASGAVPDVPIGSIRLWDAGTTWRQIELAPGSFSWATLDRAVEAAEEAGARPVLVLGQTPVFHAEDPAADGFHGVGTSSMPELDAWRRYVEAAADRYGDRVDYQVWNEPNVVGFWSGTTEQMARLTAEVHEIVDDVVGDDATVVAPSFPLRLEAQQQWFADYWATTVDGRNVSEYVDVVAVNLYPLPEGLPEDTGVLLEAARASLPDEAADLPLWDTEINFGLPQGGEAVEPISEELQRAFVIRTYLLSAEQDLARVFWYRWDIGDIANTKLTENDQSTPTLAGEGYRTAHTWLAGTEFQGCEPPGEQGVYRCVARDDEGYRVFYWSPSGEVVTIRTPETTRSWTDAAGETTDREGSYDLTVGASPIMLQVSG